MNVQVVMEKIGGGGHMSVAGVSVEVIDSALRIYSFISVRNILRIFVMSAPFLRKYAAASKVRTPVLVRKLFVSIKLLELAQTVVILDHHRQSGEAIDNAVLSYACAFTLAFTRVLFSTETLFPP